MVHPQKSEQGYLHRNVGSISRPGKSTRDPPRDRSVGLVSRMGERVVGTTRKDTEETLQYYYWGIRHPGKGVVHDYNYQFWAGRLGLLRLLDSTPFRPRPTSTVKGATRDEMTRNLSPSLFSPQGLRRDHHPSPLRFEKERERLKGPGGRGFRKRRRVVEV